MKFFKLAVPLLVLFSAALFFGCEPEPASKPAAAGGVTGNVVPTGVDPAEPVFISVLGTDPETQIDLSWSGHTYFGKNADGTTIAAAASAYTVEISTDGTTFTLLPTSTVTLSKNSLTSADKAVTVSGLTVDTAYWFRLTATNANNSSTTSVSKKSITTVTKEKLEASKQSTYAKEEDGAPSRASWVDTFRRYPSIDFLENARYVLVWRKDPGTPGPAGDYSPAERYELHQIIFNDPTAMKDPAKFGAAIDPADVKEVKIIAQGPVNQTDNFNRTATETSPNGKAGTLTYKSTVPAAGVIVTVPTDVLPAVTAPNSPTSAASSDDANNINTPIELSITQHTQVGYVAIDNINTTARPAVVAYKVRLFRSKQDLDDQGNTITKDLYNDSTVIFVNWRDGKIAQSAGGGSSGNNPNGGSKDHVPDVITSRAQVNAKLGFSANQYFTPAWESRQVTGTTPLEQLITKTDYEALFPYALQKQNIPALHDQDGTYYTWDNLVKASRYFPKFLSEGTKEDRYRELAAFLGNKSHETGDGWPAMGADRWKMGLVWIVELSALGSAGVTVKTKDDLYKAYARDSYLNEDPEGNYKAVDGKSYHGRGPVQLSHPVNYGQMSDTLFGDKTILLENPDLIARDGVYGWASAIWFWMQPQSQKPSAHDVMVGKVDLTEPYNVPTKSPINNTNWTARRYETTSKGSYADGSLADYGQMQLQVPKGMEVGFGMTINIINGGLESGTLDGRQARRITFYARYLDYFGTVKNGRNDGKNEPISPQVGAPGGDPVDPSVVTLFKGWKNWLYHESNGPAAENFPKADIPNVVSSRYTSSLY